MNRRIFDNNAKIINNDRYMKIQYECEGTRRMDMRCIYLILAAAVLCLSAETAFAQSYYGAPAIVNGANNDTIDFGFIPIPKFFIGDWVWYDSNNNGLQDDGEEGIAGVTVELWQGDAKIDTKITEDIPNKGRYIFPGLSNGEYEVRIPMDQPALEGMINTTPNVPPDDSVDSDGTPTPS